MKGSADLVSEGKDGALYVIDIKTGSDSKFRTIKPEDPVVGGTKLQLPVYAYAARDRFGDASTPVHAAYWFVRRDKGRRGLDMTPELETRYGQTIEVLVDSIAAGLFPLRPPVDPDFAWVQCPYCNPDGIGHAGNRKAWERKRHDPVLRGLMTLLEPDAVSAGQGEEETS